MSLQQQQKTVKFVDVKHLSFLFFIFSLGSDASVMWEIVLHVIESQITEVIVVIPSGASKPEGI